MKKTARGEGVLSIGQLQAIRLNELEHRRLQQNLHVMQDDFKIYLERLQRQAQDLKSHYTNVVRVVKSKSKYNLWKDEHMDEMEQHPKLTKRKSSCRTKQQQCVPSLNEIPEEPNRPLLLLLVDDKKKKPIVESLIDFNTTALRPSTSPIKPHLPDVPRQHALSNMFQQSKQFEHSTISPLPSLRSTSARKIRPIKSPLSTVEQDANLDALYRIALQNQAAYKSVDQRHIVKRNKLIDRNIALKATIRSAACVN